jgi:hypothetical protein
MRGSVGLARRSGFCDAFGFEVAGEFELPMNELFTGPSGRSWLYVRELTTSSE